MTLRIWPCDKPGHLVQFNALTPYCVTCRDLEAAKGKPDAIVRVTSLALSVHDGELKRAIAETVNWGEQQDRETRRRHDQLCGDV